LTSKAINFLHQKAYGGNLALKIDISKAFWHFRLDFLAQSFKKFWFLWETLQVDWGYIALC
jgi:hypothetical protein